MAYLYDFGPVDSEWIAVDKYSKGFRMELKKSWSDPIGAWDLADTLFFDQVTAY